MIEIVNKKTYKGHDAVYVGRGSPLGNPYSHKPGTMANFQVGSRDEAIAKYKRWLCYQITQSGFPRMLFFDLVKFYKDFGKLKLMCWCTPKACHAEVIAEMVKEYARQAHNKSQEQGKAVETASGCEDVQKQDVA